MTVIHSILDMYKIIDIHTHTASQHIWTSLLLGALQVFSVYLFQTLTIYSDSRYRNRRIKTPYSVMPYNCTCWFFYTISAASVY